MLRIDENTYIDDTLVTCAEYQLFIDEMREQGRFYQPDHWSSYQFPTGQALAPIVGVRFRDIEAFCRWLTQRGEGEWAFRLPTSTEVERYPLTNYNQSPLGYWTVGQDGNAQFAWIGPVPANPRAHSLAYVLDTALNRAIILAFNRALAFDIDRDVDLAISISHNRDLDRDLALKLDLARIFARATSLNRVIDFDRDIVTKLGIERTLVLKLDLTRACDRDLTRDRASNSTLTIAHNRDLACVLARDRALDLARDRTRDDALDIDLNLTCDLYIDFYTLQERIAGRSPAFEGIRIVKERVK